MKKFLMMLLLAFSLIEADAQNQEVKGKITDENGKPLAGATVAVKGTSQTAVTDVSGNFQISTGTQGKPIITISYVGYENLEYPIKGRSGFTITLRQDARSLSDVIVIGYGTQRKRDITGATSQIKADEIAKRPITRAEEALRTVSGVTVQSMSGTPGQGPAVRIRGTASINNNNDPLYVIDGYIGADLSSISVADIESMEILKDASATAIYGSRGSTGVVIITTKLGKEGRPRIDFNPWFKKEMVAKELHLMNAYQFAIATNAQYAVTNPGQAPSFSQAQIDGFKTNPGTDWQHALQVKPWVKNWQVSVSGGSADVKYAFSYLNLDQPGLILNQYFKNSVFRGNVGIKVSDRLNLQFNVSTSLPQSRNTQYQGDITDPFAQAFEWDPTSPIKDANGNYILESQFAALAINPIAQVVNGLNDNSSTNIAGTGILTYKILKGLTFTSNNTYTNGSYINPQLYGPGTAAGFSGAGYALQNSGQGHSFQNSNFLTYHGDFGDHSLTVTALYEQSMGTSTNLNGRANNLSSYSLGYYNLGLGATQLTTSGYSSQALQSYMGRVEYKYKDKYLVSGTIRDDGTSVLTQKYSTFPSAAVGWILSKEDFMNHSKTFSFLKLRGSWGITGNQTVGAYSSIPQIGVGGIENASAYFYNGTTPSIYTPLGTPKSTSLKWEDDATTDVGVDAAFLNGRITFTVDAYHKKVTNLLYNLTAPQYLGGGGYQTNLGSLENKGLEFALGATPVAIGKFRWNTNFLLTINRNKLLSLNGLDNIIVGNIGSAQTGVAILKVGDPLGEFYGYKFLGTWKTSEAAQAALYGNKPGDSKYLDVLGTHTINATNDRIPIGNGSPKYTWSWENDLSYGHFSLSFLFYASHGNQIYSGTFPYTMGGLGDARNATSTDILKVWTPSKQTDIPTFSPTSQNYINSSRWVYDGSFIKLENLSLSYHIPDNLLSRVKMHNLEIYVSGQNLITITKYPGYDPEVTNMTNGITQGLETGIVPNPRAYTFGVRAGF